MNDNNSLFATDVRMTFTTASMAKVVLTVVLAALSIKLIKNIFG